MLLGVFKYLELGIVLSAKLIRKRWMSEKSWTEMRGLTLICLGSSFEASAVYFSSCVLTKDLALVYS